MRGQSPLFPLRDPPARRAKGKVGKRADWTAPRPESGSCTTSGAVSWAKANEPCSGGPATPCHSVPIRSLTGPATMVGYGATTQSPCGLQPSDFPKSGQNPKS